MTTRGSRFCFEDPWSRRRAGVTGGLIVVAALLIVGGWSHARAEVALEHQTPGLNSAVAGLAVALGALAGWLAHGRRRIRHLRRLVLARPGPEPAPAPSPGAAGQGLLVVVRRGSRYHRSTCLLVNGKATLPVASGSLAPCEICRP